MCRTGELLELASAESQQQCTDQHQGCQQADTAQVLAVHSHSETIVLSEAVQTTSVTRTPHSIL